MRVCLLVAPFMVACTNLSPVEAVHFFHSKCNYLPDKMPSLTEAAKTALAKAESSFKALCLAIENSYAYVQNEWRMNNIDDERRNNIMKCLEPLESLAEKCPTKIWLGDTTVIMHPQDLIPSNLADVRHFSAKTEGNAEYFNIVVQAIPDGTKGEGQIDAMLEFLDDAESKANK